MKFRLTVCFNFGTCVPLGYACLHCAALNLGLELKQRTCTTSEMFFSVLNPEVVEQGWVLVCWGCCFQAATRPFQGDREQTVRGFVTNVLGVTAHLEVILSGGLGKGEVLRCCCCSEVLAWAILERGQTKPIFYCLYFRGLKVCA